MPQTVSTEVIAPSARVRRTMKTCAAKGKSIPQAVTGAVMMRRVLSRPPVLSVVRWAEGKNAPREALFDPFAQTGLVVFDGEDVVSPFILNDMPGAFALRVERVRGDDDSIEFERLKQFGQGGDFVALVVDLNLILDNGPIMRECGKEVEFVFMGFVGPGASHGFTIDRDGLGRASLKLA